MAACRAELELMGLSEYSNNHFNIATSIYHLYFRLYPLAEVYRAMEGAKIQPKSSKHKGRRPRLAGSSSRLGNLYLLQSGFTLEGGSGKVCTHCTSVESMESMD